MRSSYLLLILLFSGLVAFGCNQGAQQSADEQKESAESAQSSPGESFDVSDAEITASVKTKLMTDENVAARRIDVNTENGIVTLRGTVNSATEADRAVELAKTADGVRLVHSYLKTDSGAETGGDTSDLGEEAQDALNKAGNSVETGLEQAQDLGSDAAITAQIKWQLAKDKMVQAADIDVDTKDRRVVLSGTVSSQQEAQRALQIAQSIEDVLEVDSNLRVR